MTRLRFVSLFTGATLALALVSFAARAQTAASSDDVNAAAAAFRDEKYAEAIRLFRKVVAADPANAAAWHFLGESLEKTGNVLEARRAYTKAIDADPDGKVAERTRPLLKDLSLPDAATIPLPSGITLLDWMNLNLSKPSAPPMELIKLSTGYIRDYAPYIQLQSIRARALDELLSAVSVNTVDAARKSLPLLAELRSAAGDAPEVLALAARAEHVTGDFAAAKRDYGKWVQVSPADAPNRENMLRNLLLAGRNEPPTAPRPFLSFSLPESFWTWLEALDAYRNAPPVKPVSVSWDRHFEPGGASVRFGHESPYTDHITRVIVPLGVPGCYTVKDPRYLGHDSSTRPAGSYCAGGFLALEPDSHVDVTGSIFPLKTGASMILVDSRIAQMVQTSRFTVGPKMKASAINPSLEGDAWELKIRKSTSLNDLIDEYNDVYLESLGVPLSTLGYQYLADVGRTMHHKAVFPAAGFTAHQANGDKSTFANIQIKLQ